MANHYFTSTGESIPKTIIDRRIRRAKRHKLEVFYDEHGYYFCEECGKSNAFKFDCSHIKSVDWCQKNRQAELAWDVKNIRLLCRGCHQEYDGLNLQCNKK